MSGFSRNTKEWLLDWLEVRQTVKADGAFAPSQLSADYYEKIEGFRPEVIHTPFQVDEIEYNSTIYDREFKGKKYFLYFGTLNRAKGVDILADVIPNILQKWKDVHFVFIGRDFGMPGFNSIYQFILDKCQPFQTNLHYLQPLHKIDLVPIIRGAFCVLMPSRTDNYPNACLEALACGVPVIGTYESSLDEIILEGKTGFLASNTDANSLQEKIVQLLTLSDGQISKMKNEIDLWVKEKRNENDIQILVDYYESMIMNFMGKNGQS
jgi:glycosyltransferase involved in cell wall biosynthesis